MSVLPVIERELRAASRQPATYWVRVFGVLSLLGVLCFLVGLAEAIGPQIGGRLFGALHGTLLVAIWILVPLLTADCISSERREGTLPLLFLTPLKPLDIVCAKGAAHGFRAFTLWLAVLPIMVVPLLAGGVGPTEILMSALVNWSSVCLAISAGILASASCKVWSRAMALSICLAFSFGVVLMGALPLLAEIFSKFKPWRTWYYQGGFGMAIMHVANPGGVWGEWLSRLRGSVWSMLRAYVLVAIGSTLVLLLVILLAAWCVKRSWREEPASARVQAFQDRLTRPVFFLPFLKRWLHWQLQRNPIGWLEQRSWSSRLVVWSWFAVVVCIYSSLFSNFSLWHRGFISIQHILASLLAGSMAVSAAGSFRRERETGILELLLIAPMEEWQLIGGRIRGLWTQFLPAIVLLCSVWLYCATFLTHESVVASVILYCMAFASLPVIGLYFSLARTNFMASLLWTLFVGIAVPAVLARILLLLLDFEPSTFVTNFSPALLQMLIAYLLALRLHHNLRFRKFALEAKGR